MLAFWNGLIACIGHHFSYLRSIKCFWDPFIGLKVNDHNGMGNTQSTFDDCGRCQSWVNRNGGTNTTVEIARLIKIRVDFRKIHAPTREPTAVPNFRIPITIFNEF